MNRAVVLNAVLLASTAAADPLVEHAARATAAGDHAQAVADLRRSMLSILTAPDDASVRGELDRAHAAWLGAVYARHAAAAPTARLAALRILLEEARRVGSQSGIAALTALRDALVTELLPTAKTGPLATRLVTARRLQQTAGSGTALDELVAALGGEVDARVGLFTGSDADTTYLRERLRWHHGTTGAPAHPRPISARWTIELAPSSCDDVMGQLQRGLTARGGADEIRARMSVTECAATEEQRTRTQPMTYFVQERVPRTLRSWRTVKETQQVPVSKNVCNNVQRSAPITTGGGIVVDRYEWSSRQCTTVTTYESEEVERQVLDESIVEEMQSVPRTESVTVTTRTSRLQLRVVIAATAGGRTSELATSLVAVHEDEQYSGRAGSRSFGDARTALRTDLVGQLETQLADFARLTIQSARLATLRTSLETTVGTERAGILRALAVEEGAARDELVAMIAAATELPPPAIAAALAGTAMEAVFSFPDPGVDLTLPAPDASAVRSVELDEERALFPGGTRSAHLAFGLGRVSAMTSSGYGATVTLRFGRSPRALLFRVPRASVFGEGMLHVSSGADGLALVGGVGTIGVTAGVKVGPLVVEGLGIGGFDGLHQFTDEGVMRAAGDPGIPFALYLGYGAALRLGSEHRALALEVRREHRRDETVPRAWIADARYYKSQIFFIGARGAAYEAGPSYVGLQLGITWNPQDVKSGRYVDPRARTRLLGK